MKNSYINSLFCLFFSFLSIVTNVPQLKTIEKLYIHAIVVLALRQYNISISHHKTSSHLYKYNLRRSRLQVNLSSHTEPFQKVDKNPLLHFNQTYISSYSSIDCIKCIVKRHNLFVALVYT